MTAVRSAIATLLVAGVLSPASASAQMMPARFYWKNLSGGNAVPVIVNSISGNSNPFDPASAIVAGAQVDATIAMAGYVHTFTLGGRAAVGAVLVPFGRVSGQTTVSGKTSNQSANGFGDPLMEFDLNVIGPKSQRNIPDALRYEPGFSVDLLADLAVPLGKYNNTQALNIGQNRWYGRIGAPIVWQLGPWVPGRRTTLEFFPSLWFYGANSDFVGKTLETDPKFQLDAHLSRDFTSKLWGALDSVWYKGGKATIDGVAGEALNFLGVGFTLGYQINDNVGLTVGYKSTVNDLAPQAMRMDNFTISLVHGWHPLVEAMNRLK